MENKFVQTADLSLHYLEWAGEGPPMVLLHGRGLCAQVWTPIAEAFSSEYRVLAMDLRGHGDSGMPDGDYDWFQFASDLPNFIDALHLDNVLLVAHSRGGGVAVIGGAQRAQRIRGAVLIEPNIPYARPDAGNGAGDDTAGFNSAREGVGRRRAVWDSREQFIQRLRTADNFKNWRDDILWAYVEHGTRVRDDGKVELKCTPEVEVKLLQMETPDGMLELVSRINFPLLYMTQPAPWRSPQSSPVVQAMAKSAPSFRHVEVPNASHFIPQEQPDVIVEAIREFNESLTTIGARSSQGPG